MALFQQALFLFTFLEVLLPNRNEPQTPINSQIGHTHTNKQTNWGNDNPISGGESCSSWCSWTRSISGNPAMPAGNILAERLQDLRSHQSVAYQNMSTRQNLNRDVVAKKRLWNSRFPPYGNIAQWRIHGAGIYANMTGVKNVGIHEAPYIAAPLGSYRCAAPPMVLWPAGEKCRPSDRSSGQLLSSSLIRAGCHWSISICRNPLKAMENCKKTFKVAQHSTL